MMVKFILIKSPDEKQACRDELVVYLFFIPYILRSSAMYSFFFFFLPEGIVSFSQNRKDKTT